MATQHCFAPVKIEYVLGEEEYKIKTVPANTTAVGTDVRYNENQAYVDYETAAGAAASIRFFKFAPGNEKPKYIDNNIDVHPGEAGVDVPISSDKTYLVMRQDNDGILGGSKSSRKGRKSARKGRKSARKSRRSRGSRSKK